MKKIVSLIPLFFLMLSISCAKKDDTNNKASDTSKTTTAKNTPTKNILFFGNSLTAGYGIEPEEAFPSLIQDRLDSLQYDFKVVNAGVSGETTASGNSRIDWVLKNPLDIFILELGGNDGLRGIPAAETRKNLQSIINKVEAKYPRAQIILAGMQVPPSMGQSYANEFKKIFPELAQKNNIFLIPFLLENVGGERDFNQKDGIHPNAAGARLVAENVWVILQKAIAKTL